MWGSGLGSLGFAFRGKVEAAPATLPKQLSYLRITLPGQLTYLMQQRGWARRAHLGLRVQGRGFWSLIMQPRTVWGLGYKVEGLAPLPHHNLT